MQSFDSLDLTKRYHESESYECFASISTSFSGSLGSFSSMTTRSVTSVLGSAMATALSFSDQNPVPDCPKRGRPVAYQSNPSPVDFGWLLERCDGESQLVQDVLRSFCEQGQPHVDTLQCCASDGHMPQLAFHAVKQNLRTI